MRQGRGSGFRLTRGVEVRVTVTDDEGHQATLTSALTSAVAAAPRPSVTVTSGGAVTEATPSRSR